MIWLVDLGCSNGVDWESDLFVCYCCNLTQHDADDFFLEASDTLILCVV